eukprot:m51a1_g13893 hypothetical protein (353) ;mRNA; r:688423-710871
MSLLFQKLFGIVMQPQLENVELAIIDPVAPSRTRTAAPTPTLDSSPNSSSVDVAPKGRSVQSSDAGASDLLSTAHDADDHREDADLFPRLPDGAISSGPAADDQAHAGEADEEEEEEEASNPLLPGAVVTTFVIPHEGFYSPRVPSSSTSSAVPAVPAVSVAEENHVILTSLFGRLGDVDASLNTLLPCCQGSQNALWTDAPSASRTTAAISPVVSRAVLNTPADETPRLMVHTYSGVQKCVEKFVPKAVVTELIEPHFIDKVVYLALFKDLKGVDYGALHASVLCWMLIATKSFAQNQKILRKVFVWWGCQQIHQSTFKDRKTAAKQLQLPKALCKVTVAIDSVNFPKVRK